MDRLLDEAGWILQDCAQFNRMDSLGVALREFQLPNGACDYLLFVDGKATGVIEAKKQGATLSGVCEQSEKYMDALPDYPERNGIAIWDLASKWRELPQ